MRLRFTIRDLLWLIVVVALAVGWWLDRSNLADQLGDPFRGRVGVPDNFSFETHCTEAPTPPPIVPYKD